MSVRVRVQRNKEPTASGTLVVEKACQSDPGRAPTLLLLHLSDWENVVLGLELGLDLALAMRESKSLQLQKYWVCKIYL